ncbi:MAG TPA: FKBP-type peptidyl-prolyl cis-trans isomerase [Gemmatimonas sp.]|nr:FKBP-type peptidyl-prolyl cis-trans isomerase [Gemmatimonas sp.]
MSSALPFRVAISRRSLLRRALLVPALVASGMLTACLGDDSPTGPSVPASEIYAASLGVNIPAMTKLSDALYIQDIAVGTGVEATSGKTVRLNYTGWLANGTQFDSNQSGGLPPFVLGAGRVVEGWDRGIVGMKVGGRRRLVIGSALGYGAGGSGPIPPNATMVFIVELLSVN